MKKHKNELLVTLVFVITAVVFLYWHGKKMDLLASQLQDEKAREDVMNQRIQAIQESLNSSEEEKKSLSERIDVLLTEEEVVFDAEAIMEDIRDIGELATVEYRFTNVGTIDSVNRFRLVNWKVPFTSKSIIATMDGVIKVGIDAAEVLISSDEISKTITVQIPEARILSNELFEDSLVTYVEEDSLFSDITMADGSSIREEIIAKAQENAFEEGLLTQSKKQAGMLIRCLIEAVPSVKETYTILIQ